MNKALVVEAVLWPVFVQGWRDSPSCEVRRFKGANRAYGFKSDCFVTLFLMITQSPSEVSMNSDVTNVEPNVLSCQIGSSTSNIFKCCFRGILNLLSSFQVSSWSSVIIIEQQASERSR